MFEYCRISQAKSPGLNGSVSHGAIEPFNRRTDMPDSATVTSAVNPPTAQDG